MKQLKIELWLLVRDKKTNKIDIENIYYIYEVKEEILKEIMEMEYYKNNPSFMPLDRKFAHEFKLIKTNEDVKSINDYEVLEIESEKVFIDNQLIF